MFDIFTYGGLITLDTIGLRFGMEEDDKDEIIFSS
jgi:hypothetical protein